MFLCAHKGFGSRERVWRHYSRNNQRDDRGKKRVTVKEMCRWSH